MVRAFQFLSLSLPRYLGRNLDYFAKKNDPIEFQLESLGEGGGLTVSYRFLFSFSFKMVLP